MDNRPPPESQSYQPQQTMYPPPPQPYYQYNNNAMPQQQQQQQPYGQYANNVNQAEQQYNMLPFEKESDQPKQGIRAWRDLWALILWILNLGAFIGVSVLALQVYRQNHAVTTGGVASSTQYSGLTFDTSTFKIFGLAAVVGFGISLLYLVLVNAIPKQMIYITFIASIIIYFGVTIYYFTQHYYSAAIVFLIFAVLYLFTFFWWRSRIPFATAMLASTIGVMKRHPSTVVIGIVTLIIQTAFSMWFILTVVGIYERYYSTTSNNASLNLAMVFLVFSYYWTSQVISYVSYVTLAGIYASVYFNTGPHPSLPSLRRAVTTSFGSICFGSLLIALVEFLRYFISIARSSTDNPIFSFLLCIVDCLVGCFQGFFEWFNNYAFSGVAIYGKSYIQSAKRTWTIIKDRGIEAIINDNLINNVLFLGGLVVGVLCSLLGFIYLKVSQPAFNQYGNMTPVVVMMCFIVGISMFSTVAMVISSGVSTTFVCLAEDPQALQRTQPELFEKIRQTWPRVVQSV
ncbi:plasma-membrane choline transporter-domain-containing protein [Halteromyces radiatus]|uniref:plasma-membrane choline transporter-domain-containing protein n=1 Tax=Halteromyces radiatus TaxID=101107 RepID=UPI00222091BA|nr:plasma-membrane choline transporter-domain-containing protein [Halteromyces radiatus]KAI8081408.1 plasma-membrane choline transporter-domain-containing protein [Halteromyces radiatus]